MAKPVVRVEGVSKRFCRRLNQALWYGLRDMASTVVGNTPPAGLRAGEFWALNGISFELEPGSCLGLVGRNGAGKTTLLKILSGLIRPDAGRVEIRGRVAALIALGAGFNPLLNGLENIRINGSILGLSQREIHERTDEIIEFAELREAIEAPVHTYSSGMQMRLGFAVASLLDPDVLILDEVLAVGDARFRVKCYQRLQRLRKRGCSFLFVSHSATALRNICDTGIHLEAGRVLRFGGIEDALQSYEGSLDQSGGASHGDGDWKPVVVKGCPALILGREFRPRDEFGPAFFRGLSLAGMGEAGWRTGRRAELAVLAGVQGPGEVQVVLEVILRDVVQPEFFLHVAGPAVRLGREGTGDEQLRLVFPCLRLRPGAYTLKVWLSDPETGFAMDMLDELPVRVAPPGERSLLGSTFLQEYEVEHGSQVVLASEAGPREGISDGNLGGT